MALVYYHSSVYGLAYEQVEYAGDVEAVSQPDRLQADSSSIASHLKFLDVLRLRPFGPVHCILAGKARRSCLAIKLDI